MPLSFNDKLAQAVAANQSLLCVGLDPDPAVFPAHFGSGGPGQMLLDWGKRLIDQTADLVCCYKPNIAFYEQFGAAGWQALRQTIAAVPAGIPVLLDAKRGDIGSTATAYARAAFDELGADAVTVNPYLGRDSVAPFLAYPGKAVFVLCYTSNPSAAAIQEFGQGQRLFEHIVRQAMTWGEPEQIGLVVGATGRPALLAPGPRRRRAGRRSERCAGGRSGRERQRPVDPCLTPCDLRRRPARRCAEAAGGDRGGEREYTTANEDNE